ARWSPDLLRRPRWRIASWEGLLGLFCDFVSFGGVVATAVRRRAAGYLGRRTAASGRDRDAPRLSALQLRQSQGQNALLDPRLGVVRADRRRQRDRALQRAIAVLPH